MDATHSTILADAIEEHFTALLFDINGGIAKPEAIRYAALLELDITEALEVYPHYREWL